jgi:folate-binding protein YgfZ
MEKNEVVTLEDRGFIKIEGVETKDFLQNIVTNDVTKITNSFTIFSSILTPQGKYLYEFFVIKSRNGYFLDCENEFTNEIIEHLTKYKLRSKVEIKDVTSKHVIGIISFDKFKEIQNELKVSSNTIRFRESTVFVDPRTITLGARILSSLEKLHLTIKILNLKIVKKEVYLSKAHLCGIPIKGIKNLKNQLFGLEANLENFKAIDFKKGCYVGQENTARMKLKNKIRKRLLPISSKNELSISKEIFYNEKIVGNILISKPYPFALIKVIDPNLEDFIEKDLICENFNIRILNPLV